MGKAQSKAWPSDGDMRGDGERAQEGSSEVECYVEDGSSTHWKIFGAAEPPILKKFRRDMNYAFESYECIFEEKEMLQSFQGRESKKMYRWFSGVINTQPHWMVSMRLLEFQDKHVSPWCSGEGTGHASSLVTVPTHPSSLLPLWVT